MNSNCLKVVGYLFLLTFGINNSLANTSITLFNCDIDTISLCIEDAGIRLPANNKIYLGENHPDATSCSVHVSQKIKVQPTCQGVVQYEVQLFLFDSPDAVILQSATTAVTDSLLEAELSFDSELATDPEISENGIPYTTGCSRYHRIKWIVTDSCGEMSVCEKMVDVYDCFWPVTIVPSGAQGIVIPIGGSLTLHVIDFVLESDDDCTDSLELLFSFSDTQYQPIIDYDPCEAPGLGIEYPFPFWVADAGRDINCNGTVEWEERNKYSESFNIILTNIGNVECFDNYPVNGHVKTVKQGGIKDVIVKFEEPNHVFPSVVTDAEGYYEMTFLESGHLITITPKKNDNPKQGISTLDLVRIQKHLLGNEEFTSPYQYISADANNNQTVSAIDLIELRKLILGIYSELPNNTSWRFVPENYDFADTSHPWPVPQSITLLVDDTISGVNFTGIKIGDVNSSVPFVGDHLEIRNSPKIIEWETKQQTYSAGDNVDIILRIPTDIYLQGFQLTISSSDLEFIEAFSETIDMDESSYASFGDRITFSWFNEEGVKFEKDVVFILKARAIKNGDLKNGLSINSEITEAEVYSMQNEVFSPKLIISEENVFNVSQVYSPMPNPWKEKTTIPFYLNEEGNVQFEILDLNGRVIYSESKLFGKGDNEIILESKDIEARGMLLYSIRTQKEMLTGKMLVTD